MILKPQDILVVLKLVALGDRPWSFASLSVELGMSPSEVHAAVKRLLGTRLAVSAGDSVEPNLRNLEEFLLHGIQYVFVPDLGSMTRGMPTAHAGPGVSQAFVADGEPPPVWPDEAGEVRGLAFSPLYKSASVAARNDPRLYEWLVLVDLLRGGRARERALAGKWLKEWLHDYEQGGNGGVRRKGAR